MPRPAELKKAPILSSLSDSGVKKLAAAAQEKEFAAGSVIFAERSKGDSLFIILSGNVLISKATHSGEQKPIATLGAGGFFGEMALFDDYERSAAASATDDVRLLEISKKVFMEFLSSGVAGAPRVMLEIIRAIAPRIRQTNRELVALYEVGRIIGGQVELGEMLSQILAVLSSATGCSRGAIFLVNEATGLLECRAAYGYETAEPGPADWYEPLVGGMAEEIIRAESPVIIEAFRDDPRFESIQPIGYETPSMVGTALRVQGYPVGTIVLCDKTDARGKPIPFTTGDANLLGGVSAQASGAVESARLYEEAREKEKLERVYFRF